jgi:pimeloyl-ACP methyl ester carboxylesterase
MRVFRQDRTNLLRLATALVALSLSLHADPALAAGELEEIVAKLGGHPCRTGKLTCVDIDVPYDHFSNDPKRRLTVEFAVHFAEKESRGILFYVVGGPGGSGIQVADDYLRTYDERLGQRMDVVFFDQRGVGPISGIDCPKAAAHYEEQSLDPDRAREAIDAAKDFVTGCTGEMKHEDLLPYLDTEQAIRDLEAFRQAIGGPRVWLYGESYGTQFAQQYARAFPDALKGLILDGVVDLTLDSEGYYAEDARTAERLLDKTLKSCGHVPGCREDMAGQADQVFDGLAAKLAGGPLDLSYPLPSGKRAPRQMTAGMLETVAYDALYGPDDRAQFLRTLAAASRGNLVPIMRLALSDLGIDPETMEGKSDGSFYGAAYYAITCSDYGEAGADPEATAQALLERAKRLRPEVPRLLSSYYAERIACAFWPARGRAGRPKPFAGGGYPTLILNSDSDPATPISNGYAVFDHVKNGYMVTMKGGPHVIMGRGLACPDEIVFALLFDGKLPEAHEQICETPFVGSYTRLTLTDPDEARDPFALARAVEIELDQLPELIAWDGNEPLSLGCDRGGKIEAEPTERGTTYHFEDCELWPSLQITGTGLSTQGGDGSDSLTLKIEVTGAHRGQLTYRHDRVTDAMTVGGVYDNEPAATPRPLPTAEP